MAGFVYAVLGVAYAVLLGLVLVAVWEKWDAAEAIATDEANELAGSSCSPTPCPRPRVAASRSS